MKKIQVATLPGCDFCDQPAKYDSPTNFGPWANMCEEHYKEKGASTTIGTVFTQKPPVVAPTGGKPKFAATDSPFGAVLDSVREVICPDCGASRTMEPDAACEFDCEGCGIRLYCTDVMEELV
tara:strand:- start:72 stop:440 length:369 start_codon:yes stop_codon:yes gene_type:complete